MPPLQSLARAMLHLPGSAVISPDCLSLVPFKRSFRNKPFLLSTAISTMSSPSASCDPLDGAIPSLLDITISDIADGLDQGRFKCVDLVEAYLARTAEINGEFRPIIQMNPDAILIAKNLDAEMESKGRRGCVSRLLVAAKEVPANLISSGRYTEFRSTSKTTSPHMTSSMVLLVLWLFQARDLLEKPLLFRSSEPQAL